MASEDSGINEKLFGQVDESVRRTFLQKLANVRNIYDGGLLTPESDDFVSDDNLLITRLRLLKSWRSRKTVSSSDDARILCLKTTTIA